MKILEIIIEPEKVYVDSKFTLKIKVEPSKFRKKKYIIAEENIVIITENNKKIITEWSDMNEQ